MSESYESARGRQLEEEHEQNPEAFRQPLFSGMGDETAQPFTLSPEPEIPVNQKAGGGCPSASCSARAFRICDHCNEEYSLKLFRDSMSGGVGHNFSNCTNCGKRNDVWIRIEITEPNADVLAPAGGTLNNSQNVSN